MSGRKDRHSDLTAPIACLGCLGCLKKNTSRVVQAKSWRSTRTVPFGSKHTEPRLPIHSPSLSRLLDTPIAASCLLPLLNALSGHKIQLLAAVRIRIYLAWPTRPNPGLKTKKLKNNLGTAPFQIASSSSYPLITVLFYHLKGGIRGGRGMATRPGLQERDPWESQNNLPRSQH